MRDACVFVSEFNNPPKANNLISFSHRIVARVSMLCLLPPSSERDGSVENMVRVIKKGGEGKMGMAEPDLLMYFWPEGIAF